MQYKWFDERMQKPPMEKERSFVVELRQPHLSRSEHRTEVILVVEKTKCEEVSIVFHRAIRKCQIFAFETRRLMSIREVCTEEGCQVEGPVDLACCRCQPRPPEDCWIKDSMPATKVGARQDEQLLKANECQS
jgi:hypothetical protein